MINETDLNILISNIVSENNYSNCRLCLKKIEENYVSFEDHVSSNGSFRRLSEILTDCFGEEICDEVRGLDAICTNCVEKTLELSKFMEDCKNTTKFLNRVLDNLAETLNVEIDNVGEGQALYLIASKHESKLILGDIEQNENIAEKFQCVECDEIFESLSELNNHSAINHDITYDSDTCSEEIESNKTGKFKCPDCNKYKNTLERLKQHQDRVHTWYICKECGKSYKGINKIQVHEEKHNSKKECPKCGKTYNTKEFFVRHVKLCLDGLLDPHPIRNYDNKPYSCDKCEKSYSTKGGLRVHNRFIHGNAKPHVCKQCGKKFTAPSYLKVHKVTHTGEKNFKCDLCGNKFVSKEALLYHTRRHTGDKPYFCRLCDEKFVNASARAEHVKFKHVGPTLMCEICSRKFVTPHFLKQHMSRHHDPTSKVYCGRNMIPPNMPGEQNMRGFRVQKTN